MKSLPVRIVGKVWKVKRLSKRTFRKKFGTDCVAIMDMDKRKIWLYLADRETVAHELVHAYLAELCVGRADIDAAALEEVFCEFFAKFGQEALLLASQISQYYES